MLPLHSWQLPDGSFPEISPGNTHLAYFQNCGLPRSTALHLLLCHPNWLANSENALHLGRLASDSVRCKCSYLSNRTEKFAYPCEGLFGLDLLIALVRRGHVFQFPLPARSGIQRIHVHRRCTPDWNLWAFAPSRSLQSPRKLRRERHSFCIWFDSACSRTHCFDLR